MNIDSAVTSALSATGIKNVAKAKNIVYGSALAIGGVLVFVTILKIKKARERKADLKDARRYDPVDRNEELDDVGISTRNLTISNGDAILISQNLLQAMDKWGTDEESIFASLKKLNTKDDLLLVIKTFGTKPYSGTGIAENWLTRTGYKNLNGWLRAELGRRDTERVKAIYDNLGVPF